MNWMENCSFVGHNIFMKMWWECVNVFDNHFLAHFIWKFPPPKINSEGSVLVTVMSSVLVYLGLMGGVKCKQQWLQKFVHGQGVPEQERESGECRCGGSGGHPDVRDQRHVALLRPRHAHAQRAQPRGHKACEGKRLWLLTESGRVK